MISTRVPLCCTMWANSAGASRVLRHQHDAGRGEAEERLEIAVSVGRQQSHTVTSLHPEIRKHGGQPSAAIGELAVGDGPVAVDDGRAVTEATSGMLERVCQRHHRAWRLWRRPRTISFGRCPAC